jgi:hypothetical protein
MFIDYISFSYSELVRVVSHRLFVCSTDRYVLLQKLIIGGHLPETLRRVCLYFQMSYRQPLKASLPTSLHEYVSFTFIHPYPTYSP